MTYAILSIALLLILCVYLYVIAVNAKRDRDDWRLREENAKNALAAKQNDLDARDAEIERLRRVRSEYVAGLLEGRFAARTWQKWTN